MDVVLCVGYHGDSRALVVRRKCAIELDSKTEKGLDYECTCD